MIVCPNKNSEEWKLLSAQLKSEDMAMATWMYFGEDYPSSLKDTKELKHELMIDEQMSASKINSLKYRFKQYNEDNNTSHHFKINKTRGYDNFRVEFFVSYFPIKAFKNSRSTENLYGINEILNNDTNIDYDVSRNEFYNLTGKSFGKEIPFERKADFLSTISELNNKLFRENIPHVYSFKNYKEVGNSFSADIVKKYKPLNVEKKLERARQRDFGNDLTGYSVEDKLSKSLVKQKDVSSNIIKYDDIKKPNVKKTLSSNIVSRKIFSYMLNSYKGLQLKNTLDIEFNLGTKYKDLFTFKIGDSMYLNMDKNNIDSPLHQYVGLMFLNELEKNQDYSRLKELNRNIESTQLYNQISKLLPALSKKELFEAAFAMEVHLQATNQLNPDYNFPTPSEITSVVYKTVQEKFGLSKEETDKLDINLNSSVSDILKQISKDNLFENKKSVFYSLNPYIRSEIMNSLLSYKTKDQLIEELIKKGFINQSCKI